MAKKIYSANSDDVRVGMEDEEKEIKKEKTKEIKRKKKKHFLSARRRLLNTDLK